MDSTSKEAIAQERQKSIHGFVCAVTAFLIWGASPIYWKTLHTVPAFEILMHRVVWSLLFLVPFIIFQKRSGELLDALRSLRTLLILSSTTLFVATNWLIFIWAINNGHVLQTSLGYYINPLLSITMGMAFLGERLRPPQVVALLLAGAGVLYLTFALGEFPWVALSLGLSFGLYGLIRKVAPVSALVGLTVETLLLCPPALAYLLYLDSKGAGAFLHNGHSTDLLIMASALVTALPLLLFNLGTRRLHLSTVGFLQYIVPSCFFLFAVFLFREPISPVQIRTFVLIWAALAIYSADSAIFYRKASV